MGGGGERGEAILKLNAFCTGATGDANEIVSIVFPRRGIIPFSGG